MAKKHLKTDQTMHTYETTTDETISKSSISEHALIEHDKQTIKTIELDTAPQHSESILFEERTTAIDSPDVPKSIEILPVFHALPTAQEVDVHETEAQISAPTLDEQSCDVNIKEFLPLLVTQTEEIEQIGTQQRKEHMKAASITPLYETKPSTVGEEVLVCDSLKEMEVKSTPITGTAQITCVPFESKTINEEVINTKEESWLPKNLPKGAKARETIDLHKSVEITEVGTAESEQSVTKKSEATQLYPDYDVLPNIPLHINETFVQSSSDKFYPETIIATEVASPSYSQHVSYQTNEICVSEKEQKADLQKGPGKEQVTVSFTDRSAINIEMADVKDSETLFKPDSWADLQVQAQDSFRLHKELQAYMSTGIDSSARTDDFSYDSRSATVSFEEVNTNVTEITNTFQSEKPLKEIKPVTEKPTNVDILLNESYVVSQAQIQESDRKFVVEPLSTMQAAQSVEPHMALAHQHQQLLDTIADGHRKEIEQQHTAKIEFEVQKTAVGHSVLVHDSEQVFETYSPSKQPHYTRDTNVNSSITVVSPNIIDSAKPFYPLEEDKHTIPVVDIPQNTMHLGTVQETISYDSAENIRDFDAKGVVAKREPTLSHEMTVEVCTPSENIDDFKQQHLDEAKQALPNITAQSAIEVSTGVAEETLEKLETKMDKGKIANVKSDIFYDNSINTYEVETMESAAKFDTETSLKEATATTSNIKHNEKSVAQVLPLETTENLPQPSNLAKRMKNVEIIESSAIMVSTNTASYGLEDLQAAIPKLAEAKCNINELIPIQAQNVIPNESVDQNVITITGEMATAETKTFITAFNTAEHTELHPVENSETFNIKSATESVTGYTKIADTLTTATTNEILTNVFEKELLPEEPKQYKGKIQQDVLTIADQIECVPLEDVQSIQTELKMRSEQTKPSFTEAHSYLITEEKLLEKETELRSDETAQSQTVKITTDRGLNVANISEQMPLSSTEERYEIATMGEQRAPATDYNTLLGSAVTEEVFTHEYPKNVTESEKKLSRAKRTLDQRKSVRVETIEILEKEDDLDSSKVAPKVCTQVFEEHMKAAISQEIQTNEQLNLQSDVRLEMHTAKQLIEISHQSQTFETVSMKNETDHTETAQTVSERPLQALQIKESTTLLKEDTTDETDFDKQLITPKTKTQEYEELNVATKTEVQTNIESSKKTQKTTNQKEQKIEDVYKGEEKGKWRFSSLFRLHKYILNT